MIKEDFIKKLKEEADIVGVIGQYVELKQKGVNHTACCPFHTENTPSFSVSPSKGLFKCFGCGKSGDVFKFLELHKAMTFDDQVKTVAAIMRIPVEYEETNLTKEEKAKRKEKRDKSETLYIQNTAYWEAVVKNGGYNWPIKEYHTDREGNLHCTVDVFGREYTLETVHEFGLAATPVNLLSKQGKKMGFNEQNLLDGGLVVKGDRGKYDRFSGRLLFPIYISSHTSDRRGKIAGFGGRVAPNDPNPKKAKYTNSPETLTYEKSKILYGLHQAKEFIQKAKYNGSAYLVEGYTDVVTPFDFGLKNVVGKSGKFLTKEQAVLLKKYAKEAIIIPDTDPVFNEKGEIVSWDGLECVRKEGGDIDILLNEGIDVKICILPIPPVEKQDEKGKRKNDPDSFMRSENLKGFQFYVDENTEDAIEWRIKDILGRGEDKGIKTLAFETAVGMLAKIKDDYKRGQYIKTLRGAKYLDCKEAILAGAILNKQMEGQKRKNWFGADLNAAQEEMYQAFGFYTDHFKGSKSEVFMSLDGNMPIRVANFRIEPEYHVLSDTQPERKIKVFNERGIMRIIDLHTDTFVDMSAFKKAMATLGNFRFTKHCKKDHFEGIMTWLYEEMPTVLRVEKLGQHSTGQMWVWGNGVTLPNGKFYRKKENGCIAIGDETYRLPGNTDQEEQRKKLDSGNDIDPYYNTFIFVDGDCPSWEHTVKMVWDVHGQNGIVAIAYYLLCLFRSCIYPHYTQEFPILNGTGPPRKGKTQMWWLLSSFFGAAESPINMSNITPFGLTQMMETRRDAIIGLDEYKNGLDRWKIEFIKDLSDGAGRTKGSGKDSKSLSKSKILSGVYLFGQDLPTADIAMLTRMITCWFNDFDNSTESIQQYENLRTIRHKGVFSQHTSHLQQFRNTVSKHILEHWHHCKSELKAQFSKDADERVMNTHSWILSIVHVLQDHIKFPQLEVGKLFYETLFETMKAFAARQLKYIEKEDENASFWGILQNLVMVKKQLKHKEHFWVSIEHNEKYYESDTRKDSLEEEYKKPHKLIYLNVDLLYESYTSEFKGDSSGKKPLPKESLTGYLEMDKHFLGKKKGKKIGGVARMVMVFKIGEYDGDDISNGLCERSFDLPTNDEARRRFAKMGQDGNIAEDEDAEVTAQPWGGEA